MALRARRFTGRGAPEREASTAHRPREVTSQAKVGTPNEKAGFIAGGHGAAATPTMAQAVPVYLAGASISLIALTKEDRGRTKAPVAKVQEVIPSFTRAVEPDGLPFLTSAGASTPEGFCISVDRSRMGSGQAVLANGPAVASLGAEDGPVADGGHVRPTSSMGPTSLP